MVSGLWYLRLSSVTATQNYRVAVHDPDSHFKGHESFCWGLTAGHTEAQSGL